jgi:hypothetical protein
VTALPEIEAALASALATVATLQLVKAAALARETPPDELLGLEQHDVGRRALLAAAGRGEIAVMRGPRQKLLVSRLELERWLRSRPVPPRARKAGEVVDLEDWQRDAMSDVKRARRVR